MLRKTTEPITKMYLFLDRWFIKINYNKKSNYKK